MPCLRLSVPVPAPEWLLPLPPERRQQISSRRSPTSSGGQFWPQRVRLPACHQELAAKLEGAGRGPGRGPGGEQCALCVPVMLGRALVIFLE